MGPMKLVYKFDETLLALLYWKASFYWLHTTTIQLWYLILRTLLKCQTIQKKLLYSAHRES